MRERERMNFVYYYILYSIIIYVFVLIFFDDLVLVLPKSINFKTNILSFFNYRITFLDKVKPVFYSDFLGFFQRAYHVQSQQMMCSSKNKFHRRASTV